MSDTKDRIKKVLNGLYVDNMPNITVKSKFKDDLGLDSLDEQEFIMDLEDEFTIEISDMEAADIVTVEQATTFITERLNG